MSDLDALLAAVIDQPDDDTVRLAYADALEERAGRWDAARAAFIRVQIETTRIEATEACDREDEPHGCAPFKPNGKCARCRKLVPLRAREYELRGDGTPVPWLDPLHHMRDAEPVPGGYRGQSIFDKIVFRRGFVESLYCASDDWLRDGDDIRRKHPVTEVTLTTVPHLNGGPPWHLDGDKKRVEFNSSQVENEIYNETLLHGGVRQWNGDRQRAVLRLRWRGVSFKFDALTRGGLITLPPGATARLMETHS